MNRITELLALRDRAEATLVSVPALVGMRPRCHVVVLRTHIDYTSYTLFTAPEAGEAAALVRSWERSQDEEGFECLDAAGTEDSVSVQPTITSWRKPVPSDSVDALVRRAKDLEVPVCIPDFEGGQDGTTYVLSFAASALASSRFTWWQPSWMDGDGITRDGTPPPGWEGLFSMVEEIVQLAGGPVWCGPSTRNQSPSDSG